MPLGVRFAPLGPQHLPQVVQIERACFPRPWSPRILKAELSHPRARVTGAFLEPGGMVVGYCILWFIPPEVQVHNLAVHPGFQGKGIGRRLLARALAEARAQGATVATLEVRPSNLPARRVYEALGFKTVAIRPCYYRADGEDGLVMELNLSCAQLDHSPGQVVM